MKLTHPFIQLPLLFDAPALAAEVAALGEDAWLPHPQGFPGNSMLPLVASGGHLTDESFAGQMKPTAHLDRCPYLGHVIASLGVVVGRTRLMRLTGHAEVTRHADQGYYWADRVRIHVPIVTQPTVRFECDNVHTHMGAGECWIFDTWRQHRVLNDDVRSRIHLVVDTVGSETFWELVDQGRTHDGHALSHAWNPRVVEVSANARPAMRFESANIPVVMTPWELADRIHFLLDEAIPFPALSQARILSERFLRRWRFDWAEWGDRPEGWSTFRLAAENYVRELAGLVESASLRNELGLASAVSSIVRRVAVSGNDARPHYGQAPGPRAPSPAVPGKPAATAAKGNWRVAPMSWGMPQSPTPAKIQKRPLATPSDAGTSDPVYDRPVFIVSSPRSGSTMLFEALAKAPGIFTIGGESHALIEGIPSLAPAARNFESNRLDASVATREVVGVLRERFHASLRDRDGQRPGVGRMRMLEKTPKNSLRIPFLASVFPESIFVYLHRDPREVMGSMIDAWNSGKFRTYPNLPGWPGLPWSLLLVPGWRDLIGRTLPEIVAAQWESTTRLLIDDLENLPASRRRVIRYEQIIDDPQSQLATLSASLGLGWDHDLEGQLPLARYTLSTPRADKWRRHESDILAQLGSIRGTMDRAARFAGP